MRLPRMAYQPTRRFDCFRMTLETMVWLWWILAIPGAFAQNDSGGANSPGAVGSGFAVARSELADPKWSFGYELFQMLLEERGLEVSDSVDDAMRSPPESVIVMMGDLSSVSQAEWLRLQRFATNGGTVLMASDQSLSRAGFHNGPVSTTNPEYQYQGFADCVMVSDVSDRSSLTRDIREIVLNRAGWLSVPWSGTLNWYVAARLPTSCQPRQSSEQPVLLLGWPRRQGRLPSMDDSTSLGLMILAADPSLFTNLMLWHGDNAILAIRVSEMLCNGKRRRLIFLVNQDPLPSYQSSLPPQSPPSPPQMPEIPKELPEDLPEPELATMLRLANTVIRDVEESNLVNEVIANQPRNVRQPFYQRAVMMVLTGIAAFYLLWRLAQKNSVQPAVISPRSMVSSLQMKASQASQSSKAASSQYSEAAQVLARDLCRQLTGSNSIEDWQQQLSGQSLPDSDKPLKKSLRTELQFALELAVRGCSVHISRRRFEAFGKNIRELRKAAMS